MNHDGSARLWRDGLTFSRLTELLLFMAVAMTACLMPAQADTYWHLRAGQELFATGRVPLFELYSHTARGLPWPNHEWLWQALSYGFWRLGGMPLLVAFGAACVTLACTLAYRLMRRPSVRPRLDFGIAVVAIPLASVVWALRPQVVSLLCLLVLMHLLVAGRFWFVPILFVVWANLHGAVALGGAVLVTAMAVAWFGDRARFWRLLPVTIAAAVATAATPMGVGLWRFVGESMARSRQNQIMEWLPAYPTGPIQIAFWLAALVLVVAAVRRWHELDSWDDRLVVVVTVMMIPLGARAVRNISPFFLLWMPAMSRLVRPRVAPPASVNAPTSAPTGRAPEVEHPRLNLVLAAVGAVGAVVTVVLCWARPIARLGWHPVPPGVVAAVSRCPGPLYNRYDEGGYLLWYVPAVSVFVDSRQDPYPAALLEAHAAAESSGDYQQLFATYGVKCAALPPVSPVAKRLLADGWTERYRDAAWTVLHAAPRQ